MKYERKRRKKKDKSVERGRRANEKGRGGMKEEFLMNPIERMKYSS